MTNIDDFCNKLDQRNITTNFILNEIQRLNLKFIWHPLGFIMSTYLFENNKKIRIHIWPKNYSKVQFPNWNIHNHIFDLTSWVLEGKILNTEYNSKYVEDSSSCVYEVTYDFKHSILKKTINKIKLIEKAKTINIKGNKYSLKSDIFHSSILIGNKSALTLVLSVETDNKYPLVIGKCDSEEEYIYCREEVSDDLLKEIIKTII